MFACLIYHFRNNKYHISFRNFIPLMGFSWNTNIVFIRIVNKIHRGLRIIKSFPTIMLLSFNGVFNHFINLTSVIQCSIIHSFFMLYFFLESYVKFWIQKKLLKVHRKFSSFVSEIEPSTFGSNLTFDMNILINICFVKKFHRCWWCFGIPI